MSSKNVRLDEDVYERIKSKKRPDETFSEAIDRLTGGASLLELTGILSDEEADDFRRVVEDIDADAREDIDEVVARFEERDDDS
ncbi:MAG: antitoxin VapB family protein [Halopenitus sp.]